MKLYTAMILDAEIIDLYKKISHGKDINENDLNNIRSKLNTKE